MKISFKFLKSFTKDTSISLRDFNIVIGKNSAGKTAFSQAINFYFNLVNNKLRNTNSNNSKELSQVNFANIDKENSLFSEKERKRNPIISKNLKDGFMYTSLEKEPQVFLRENMTGYESSDLNKYIKMLTDEPFTSDFLSFRNAPSKVIMKYPFHIFKSEKKARMARRVQDHARSLRHDNRRLDSGRISVDKDYLRQWDIQGLLSRLKSSDIADSFNGYLDSVKDKYRNLEGVTDIQVGYRNNTIEHVIKAKRKTSRRSSFIDGLTIVHDKKNEHGTLVFHQDGSPMKKEMQNLVRDLTKKVFHSELVLMDSKMSCYRFCIDSFMNEFKWKYPRYGFSLPVVIDKSNFNNLEQHLDLNESRSPFDNVYSFFRNDPTWNSSPYIETSFVQPSRFTRRASLPSRYISNLFSSIDSLKSRRNSNNIRKIDQLSDFEFKQYNHFERPTFLGRRFNEFSEPTLYKDFRLKSISIKHKEIVDDNYPIDRGFMFSIDNQFNDAFKEDFSMENHLENLDPDYRRQMLDNKVRVFLKEVGAEDINDNYDFDTDSFNETYHDAMSKNGIMRRYMAESQEENEPDFGGVICQPEDELEFAAMYADCFKQLIDSNSSKKWNKQQKGNSYTAYHDNEKISKCAKKHNVPAKAIVHQINVIEMYLLRSAIIQFQKNLYKYLLQDYTKIINRYFDTRLLLSDNEHDPYPYNLDTKLIKPSILDKNDKKELLFSEKEINEFFNGNFLDSVTKDFSELIFLGRGERNSLQHFSDYINQGLKEMDINFTFQMEHVTKKTDGGLFKTKRFYVTVRESGGNIDVPIAECGMGNSALISILGSLYNQYRDGKVNFSFTAKVNPTFVVVIREPETYLHPKWIGKLTEYLFNQSMNSKSLKIVIETHSEVILRQTQVLMKNRKSDTKEEPEAAVFYINKRMNTEHGVPSSTIKNLGLKHNGFLSEKVDRDFFNVNTDYISELWSNKKKKR